VQEAYNADAVVGPVISRYESNVPQWVIKGNFYQRKRNKTGDIQQSAATSNVLIKNEIIRKENLSFNKQLGLSGADDECFFREFVHRGHTIIWADKAIVYEYVPSSRIGLRWLMQRSYRGGLYFTFIQLQIHPGNKTLFERIIKGGARILIGFALIIISMVRGYHTFVSGAQSIALGVGTFAGLLGLKYEEYKKIHGT
jgi:succinoglycan biosynthesis protein ExoM